MLAMKLRAAAILFAAAISIVAGMIAAPPSAAAQTGAAAGVLRVHFVGTPNNLGTVRCGLYNSPVGFPMDRAKVIAHALGPVRDQQGVCEFKGLKPGTYAVAAFQDEHGTGKITKNWLGIPTEAYGFSNDAAATISAPSFQSASFRFPGGTYDVTIHAK
jgi:uncharacterized protein (DUF2141 family)